MNKPPV